MLRILLLVSVCFGAWGVETEELARVEQAGAEVVVALERSQGGATLVATFTPVAPSGDSPWHFYSKDLPRGGLDGLGRPTLIEVPPGQGLRALGDPVADAEPHDITMLGIEQPLPVYPPGPVTLRLDVALPPGDGSRVRTEIALWWMLCNDQTCLMPVQDRRVAIEVPSDPAADPVAVAPVGNGDPMVADPVVDQETTPESAPPPQGLGPWMRSLLATLALLLGSAALGWLPWRGARRPRVLDLVAGILAFSAAALLVAGFAPRGEQGEGIAWVAVETVAEAEAAIERAHAAGVPALLDFTGPSCVNCQVMAKTVFPLESVTAAWNSGFPIEVDTDPPHEALGDWQQRRFGTQNRPLYVRLDPDGGEARWDVMVTPSDEQAVAGLVAFLRGEGEGRAIGGLGEGWLAFLLLAMAGGLFTLVMPCTYPMIPFTVTFFSKQAEGGRKLAPLAACYSLGIIAFFVLIGVVVAGIFGAGVSDLAGHPVTQGLIGLLFLVFGLALLGAFLLRLPAGLESRLGGGRGGYLGALAMGLTFAITAFTCTAPFAGLVLGEAVRHGSWGSAIIGMGVYAAMIAIPFFFLAMSPGLLHRIPRAGSWMNEFKVIGGLVELGAALKFLAITDAAYGWGLITRDPTLALWAVLSLLAAAYLLGWLRLKDDTPVERCGWWRLLTVIAFTVFGLWLLGGLLGTHLGMFEGFFPADQPPPLL